MALLRVNGSVFFLCQSGWALVCWPSFHQGEWQHTRLLSTQMSGNMFPLTAHGWATLSSPSFHLDGWQCAHPHPRRVAVWSLSPPSERRYAHPLFTGVSRCVLNFPNWVSGTLQLTVFSESSGSVLTLHQGEQQCTKECFTLHLIVSVICYDGFLVGTKVAWKSPYHYNTTLHNNTSVPIREIFQCSLSIYIYIYIYTHSKVSAYNI